MREWNGFSSHDPKDMAEKLNRYLREVSAAFKKIKDGKAPAATGASLTLANTPPAESAVTYDGSTVTPSGRLTRVDVSNPASPTYANLYSEVPVGVYRVTFGAHIISVPTTSALSVTAIFNNGDESELVVALPLTAGDYVSGTTTFPTNIEAIVDYQITYTNTVDMEFSIVLEAL